MPRRRTSRTYKLPNGNRVTVSRGRGRWRTSFSKTVSVRRPDGTGESRSYRRGLFLSYELGGYSRRIPGWARRRAATSATTSVRRRDQSSRPVAISATPPERGRGSTSIWKGIGIFLVAALYLLWPLGIDAKTVNGQQRPSTLGIVILLIWLPIAVGLPVVIWQRSGRAPIKEGARSDGEGRFEEIGQTLGMKEDPTTVATGSTSTTIPPGTDHVTAQSEDRHGQSQPFGTHDAWAFKPGDQVYMWAKGRLHIGTVREPNRNRPGTVTVKSDSDTVMYRRPEVVAHKVHVDQMSDVAVVAAKANAIGDVARAWNAIPPG